MEITELEKQFAALAEEIEKLKNSNTLTEAADDGAEEEITDADMEEVAAEAVPEEGEEEVKEEEKEEEVVEEAPVEDSGDKKLIDSISGNLLRTFMDALNEINILKSEAHDEKFDVVFDEIADNTNKVIGSLQAVLGEGNADADAQEEAREEAEDKIEGEEPEIEEAEKEDELEVIKPVEGEEEEIEEVAEDEVEESLNESIEITKSFGIEEFEPWGPAVRIWDYITDLLSYSKIEACLESYFGEDAEIDETDLNDFIGYHQIGANAISDEEFWEIFDLADPDAEYDEVEEEDVDFDIEESCDNPDDNPDDIIEAKEGKCHRR